VKKLFCIGSDSDLNFNFFQKNIDFKSFDKIDESSFGKFLIKVKNSFISL
jgi:tRNA(adenine34) deaminase